MQFLQGAGDVGLQGLGTLVRILDLAASAKRGNIGGSLLQQAMASQDPNARAAIEQSPFLAGFTGNYGSRQPTPVDMSPGGPSAPERQNLFRADLPPLNPQAQAELELLQAKGPLKPIWPLRMLDRYPLLRRIPAAFLGFGLKAEHVRSPTK